MSNQQKRGFGFTPPFSFRRINFALAAAILAGFFAVQNAGAFVGVVALVTNNGVQVIPRPGDTQADANARAIRLCKLATSSVYHPTCDEIDLEFANQCIHNLFIVVGDAEDEDDKFFIGIGNTPAEAQADARTKCEMEEDIAANDRCQEWLPSLAAERNICDMSCTDNKEVVDITNGVCESCGGDLVANGGNNACECPANMPVKNGTNCRPQTQAECDAMPTKPVLDDGACRPQTQAECDAMPTKPVLENGACRPQTRVECEAMPAKPVLDNGACRARIASDCTGATPELGDDGECRARIASDCTGATPELGDDGECRARIASDCTGATPELGDDGECRARMASDCTGATPIFMNGECVPDNGGGGAPTPTPCGANEMRNDAGDCVCVSGYTKNNANECEMDSTPPPDCGQNQMRNPAGVCVCESGFDEVGGSCLPACGANQIRVGGVCQTAADCAADGPAGSERNAANECVCPSGAPNLYTAGGEPHCTAALPSAGRYTANECESAGWDFAATVNGNFIRETCGIPFRLETEFTPPAALGVRPLVVAPPQNMTDYDSCVLREHAMFNDGETLPECEDGILFGLGGLPQKPADFPSGSRITVAAAGLFYNNAEVSRFGGGATSSGGNDRASEYATAIGIMVLIGALIHSDIGEGGNFSFNPDYAFSSTDGSASYFYGSRLDYRGGDFSAYWRAGRRHSGAKADAWNAAAGAEYGRDFWKIGYAGKIFGEKTDLELSALLSEKTGVFGYSSGMVWDYKADGLDGETSAFWRNSLTADYGNWRLMPSADFRWRGGKTLDGGNFRIDLRREF